ncbi:uncharacterized protein FTJAE_6182 [Fusarium tjaetaba]|uniref:Uncharacterized protein n=1 Tax=Fusarium tjaetaba TaxID=1567544 RepID=A0A8H5RMJ2_9HYPO|nr:uncharacterized protein FTJAE_6182 [Fusarium tjaetaba]KAF5636234.1 hypothetical protein FTJAE_6182 [Fusarium tjaetaba]
MRRPEVQSHEPVIEGWIGWPSYGVDKLPGGKLPYLPCLAMPYYAAAARQKAFWPLANHQIRSDQGDQDAQQTIDGGWLLGFGFCLSRLSTKEQEEKEL